MSFRIIQRLGRIFVDLNLNLTICIKYTNNYVQTTYNYILEMQYSDWLINKLRNRIKTLTYLIEFINVPSSHQIWWNGDTEKIFLTNPGFVQINIWCYLYCKRLLSQKLNAKSLKFDNNIQ